jgi:predicted RNA-binding protein with PUA-like domain
MARGCWLVKQEPSKYTFADLVRDKRTMWEGVRNFQARNNLAAMRRGDRVLFYRSVADPAVVGVCEVAKEAYPDPTAGDPRWVAVDLKAVGALAEPVTLARIKAEPALRGISLVRQSRLSVMPLPPAAFERIVKLGG